MQGSYANHVRRRREASCPNHSAAMAKCYVLLVVIALACVCALVPCWPIGPCQALAANGSARPSVLVVDAGLGEFDECATLWLGENAQKIAEDHGFTLATAADPTWWAAGSSAGKAPATFVLSVSGASPLTADGIAWALDRIRQSGAEPRTFVIAMGVAGLPLREYVQDLALQKQSNRADVVGLGFCGTPQQGYSAMATYPELNLWEKVAKSVGLEADDLNPGSPYLSKLNGGSFPAIFKTLSISGSIGDLGFGFTDGLGVGEDFAIPASVSNQVTATQVEASTSHSLSLTSTWQPFASAIDYPQRNVDAALVDGLSAAASYETSGEVQEQVRQFYELWFTERAPVTHNSNVLALDLSGSMNDMIANGEDKLAAAKVAAADYLLAMQAVDDLPMSAPMDVSVFGFEETLTSITDTFDDSACAAIGRMIARGDTNIGLALERAVSTLRKAPTCAEKHVVLLSDGDRTQGMTNDEMLAGPVAEARELGIVIDTVGFGDVGDSDEGFLREVASRTGGKYYQATDTYDLAVGFLSSYYSSLGLSLVDEELPAGHAEVETIGSVDDWTSALEVGIVAEGELPQVQLMCNGAAVDEGTYVQREENGLLSLQCVNPPKGDYSLRLSGGTGSKHVFAVKQQGMWHGINVVGEKKDYSLYLLVGAGVLLVVALVITVLTTRRRKLAAISSAAGAGSVGRGDK